jgi:hypothetical protein
MTTPTHLLHSLLLDEGMSDTSIQAIKDLVRNILDEEIHEYIQQAKKDILEDALDHLRKARLDI